MQIFIMLAAVVTIAFTANLRDNNIKSLNVSYSELTTVGRIFKGQNATLGQFPYQAGIYGRRNNIISWCGGSLIGDRWVMTAAHCTVNATELTVYLGTIIYKSGGVSYKVHNEDIITHNKFNLTSLEHDIALIKIPVTKFTANMKPVKLPAINGTKHSYAGRKAVASGWGHTQANQKRPYKYLQWASIEIKKNNFCSPYYLGLIKSSMMCTFSTRKANVCQGDSGGPLVLKSEGVQVGVIMGTNVAASFSGIPGVYTRVTSYLEWIKTHTGISYTTNGTIAQ